MEEKRKPHAFINRFYNNLCTSLNNMILLLFCKTDMKKWFIVLKRITLKHSSLEFWKLETSWIFFCVPEVHDEYLPLALQPYDEPIQQHINTFSHLPWDKKRGRCSGGMKFITVVVKEWLTCLFKANTFFSQFSFPEL